MKIKTNFDYPPIPVRDMDYSAWDDDTLDGAPDAGPRAQRMGRGRTALLAIYDLAAQWMEDFTEADIKAGLARAIDEQDGQTALFWLHVRELCEGVAV